MRVEAQTGYCREAALKFDLRKETQSTTRTGTARARPDCPLPAPGMSDLRMSIGPPMGTPTQPTDSMAQRRMAQDRSRVIVGLTPAANVRRDPCEQPEQSSEETRLSFRRFGFLYLFPLFRDHKKNERI